MSNLLEAILNCDFSEANDAFNDHMSSVVVRKLEESKKIVSAKMFAEMNLKGMQPDYANIEDRRGERGVNSSIKTDLGGEQKVDRSGKSDMAGSNTTVIKKTPAQPIKEDEEQLDEARIKIVTRIRGGKIQRRKKLSNVPGMTLRGGKLTRMSPAERRKRKMGARKAKIKRRTKRAQANMKRKRSIMRRKAMGL